MKCLACKKKLEYDSDLAIYEGFYFAKEEHDSKFKLGFECPYCGVGHKIELNWNLMSKIKK